MSLTVYCSGKILQDSNTVESYNIQGGYIVCMVSKVGLLRIAMCKSASNLHYSQKSHPLHLRQKNQQPQLPPPLLHLPLLLHQLRQQVHRIPPPFLQLLHQLAPELRNLPRHLLLRLDLLLVLSVLRLSQIWSLWVSQDRRLRLLCAPLFSTLTVLSNTS